MKKKFKVTLVVFLVVILGCFSETFAASNQNNKMKKIAEFKKSVRLLDATNTQNTKWNAQDKDTNVSLSNNDLTARVTGGKSKEPVKATNYKTSGKWYWEISIDKFNSQGKYYNGSVGIGIANKTVNISNLITDKDNQLWFYACKDLSNYEITTRIGPDGKGYPKKYGQLYTTGDTVGIALDLDNKTIKFSVNGKWYDNVSIPSWDEYFPFVFSNSSITSLWQDVTGNFGATAFKNPIPAGYVPFDTCFSTAISLNKTTDSLILKDSVKGTDTLIATVTPDNATNKAITWKSSDENIVKVDQNGNITATGKGTATITAETTDGTNLSASCTVTVKEKETEKFKLTLYMNNATTREFYLTQDEIDDFLNWYTSKTKGEVTLQPYYVFNVSVPGTSSTKKSYVWFMKIESFEIE